LPTTAWSKFGVDALSDTGSTLSDIDDDILSEDGTGSATWQPEAFDSPPPRAPTTLASDPTTMSQKLMTLNALDLSYVPNSATRLVPPALKWRPRQVAQADLQRRFLRQQQMAKKHVQESPPGSHQELGNAAVTHARKSIAPPPGLSLPSDSKALREAARTIGGYVAEPKRVEVSSGMRIGNADKAGASHFDFLTTRSAGMIPTQSSVFAPPPFMSLADISATPLYVGVRPHGTPVFAPNLAFFAGDK